MSRLSIACGLLLIAPSLVAQTPADFLLVESGSLGEGWRGFTDIGFLFNALLTLVLATVLGSIIAYHPKRGQMADTPEEIEAPKVYITYAMIGAIIGIMVVKYGMVVGFVLFGIGGLIRFRTVLRSATLTGDVIFVTLIGLSCGLDLPHVAVLSTAFGFVLIYILDAKIIYRIDVMMLTSEIVGLAAKAYRQVLEQHGCRVLSEKKSQPNEESHLSLQTQGNYIWINCRSYWRPRLTQN
ncbi:MAG: hypothetical protein QF877_07335 [Gammaproteobacteria bacterium]|nr:hypothetical protein [Gammaproteobacteria bacterium]